MHAEPVGKQMVYETTDEAELKTTELFLRSKGIDCELYEVNTPRTRVFTTSKIYVYEKDVESAKALLKDYLKDTSAPKLTKTKMIVTAAFVGIFVIGVVWMIVKSAG